MESRYWANFHARRLRAQRAPGAAPTVGGTRRAPITGPRPAYARGVGRPGPPTPYRVVR
jgi:hypothetical protein